MAVSQEILATQWQTVIDGNIPTLPTSVGDFIVFVNNVVLDTNFISRTGEQEITLINGYTLNENDKVRVLVPIVTPQVCAGNMVYPDSPNVNELYSCIRSEMRVDRRGRIWSNADLLDAINEAIFSIQASTNFGWEQNDTCTIIDTVSGQEEYDLPNNLQAIKLVEHRDDTLMSTSKLDVIEMNDNLPSGTPQFYYIYGGKLWLSPIPTVSNVQVKIYNQKFLTPLSQDTDTLPFPAQFKKAVTLFAAYDLFSQTSDAKNSQRAQVKYQRYKEELNKIRLGYLIPDSNQVRYDTRYVSASRRGIRRTRNRTVLLND